MVALFELMVMKIFFFFFFSLLSEPSSDQPNNIALNSAVLTNLAAATQNSTVTPQVALLQTMAAMHKKVSFSPNLLVHYIYFLHCLLSW